MMSIIAFRIWHTLANLKSAQVDNCVSYVCINSLNKSQQTLIICEKQQNRAVLWTHMQTKNTINIYKYHQFK